MSLSRRNFLRAAGVTLALPRLAAFASAADPAKPPRRMVCLCAGLGLHAPYFFPEKSGRDYELSPYLELLKELRGDFTVISGLSHPDVGPTHDSMWSFLTAAPHPEVVAGFRNTISLDQFAADYLRGQTRFTTLPLAPMNAGISFTRSGAPVPGDTAPSAVFTRLFVEGRPNEVKAQSRRLRNGQSILDAIGDQSKALVSAVGAADREKLDEYFTSIRELEQRLVQAEQWAKKPKPKVDVQPPQTYIDPSDLVAEARAWFDVIHLALQTDSTRLVALPLLGASGVPPIPGVSLGHHDLSHHGKDPAKIDQLKKIELATMNTLRDFLKKLKDTKEDGETLLDRTMVFFGSNLGNASIHAVKNLPVLVAGGGFKHGQHLAFNPDQPPPLSNLYLSMLHRLDIPADQFGSSTGTLTGLDIA